MNFPIDINLLPRKKGVYFVGGSIRDLLCGRTPVDYDLVVATDPSHFARSLAANTAGQVVEFGKHGHTILRVVTRGHYFDIMPFNGASIEDDLRRRDFTINAMALEVSSGSLIDLAGGQQDLTAKKIRKVADDVFQQDPVRMIRAYRLAAHLDFAIDHNTETNISRDADLIRRSAGERIRDELFKILDSADSHIQLARMTHSGLLFCVIPELLQLRNYRPCANRLTNLFEQSLEAYTQLENLLYARDQKSAGPVDRLVEDMDPTRSSLLKWAVLLQNIGLPAARPTSMDGSTFDANGHAAQSAVMAGGIFQRLRFSKRQSGTIEFIIRHRLRPFFLYNSQQEHVRGDRAFIRFFMRCGDFTPDILLHALAGFSSRRAAQDPSLQRFAEFIAKGINTYFAVLQPRALQPRPLNGNDLIKDFGLKPSAAFKQILKAIEEEHLANPNLTRAQALKWVKKQLSDLS